mgnify:CR=1 FL=1
MPPGGRPHGRRCPIPARDTYSPGIDQGWFPAAETQIPLFDVSDYPFAYLDMGWRDKKIAVEYDGEHHRTDPDQYRWDILRLRRILALGWIHIKVIAGDNEFIHHVKQAWLLREREARAVDRPA